MTTSIITEAIKRCYKIVVAAMSFATGARGPTMPIQDRVWLPLFVATVLGLPCCMVNAQSFANLGFEASPYTASDISLSAPTSQLFPFWTLRFGNTIQTTASLNDYLLAGPQAALMISDTPNAAVLAGSKSLYLAAWVLNGSVSIAQEGEVPPATRSLRFLSRNPSYPGNGGKPGPFELRLDGQNVPLVVLSSVGGDFLYGSDISAFAGSTAEMRIAISTFGVPGYTGWAFIDAIEFSPDPIPEPAATAIVAAFAGWLLGCRRTRQR